MKKSVFTLLAIATAVVSMSSCSQDGGSSNDLNLTETTQAYPTTNATQSQSNSQAQSNTQSDTQSQSTSQATFKYQASIANDALDVYDITITRTANGQTKTYTFDKAGSVRFGTIYTGFVNYDGKTMDKDSFAFDSNAEVKVTVTLKADWQARLAAKGDGTFALVGNVSKGANCASCPSKSNNFGMIFKASNVKQKTLEDFAKQFAYNLKYAK